VDAPDRLGQLGRGVVEVEVAAGPGVDEVDDLLVGRDAAEEQELRLAWALDISRMALQISRRFGRASMWAKRMTSGLSFRIESMKDSMVFFSMLRISRSGSASRALRMPARMMSDGQKTRRVIFCGLTAAFFFSMLASAPFSVVVGYAGLSLRERPNHRQSPEACQAGG